jgi:hypothetical protein
MALKTYSGGCHCGAVRYEADIDLSEGTYRCNCSLCTKARAWFVPVRPDRFRFTEGADAQTVYEWTPPGRPRPNLHFGFCRTCGIRTTGLGDHGPDGGPFRFIAVASLDAADPDELAASVRYLDGRHDRFDRPPEDIRVL